MSLLRLVLILIVCAGVSSSQQNQRSTVLGFAPQSSSLNHRPALQYQSSSPFQQHLRGSSIVLPANNNIQATSSIQIPSLSASAKDKPPQQQQNLALSSNSNDAKSKQAPNTPADISQQRASSSGPLGTTGNYNSNESEEKRFIHQHAVAQAATPAKNLLSGTIEMALRQTSGDESYFQAPPAVDWLSNHDPLQSSSGGQVSELRLFVPSTTTGTLSPMEGGGHSAAAATQEIGVTSTTTTTEESNLILDGSASGPASSYNPGQLELLQQQAPHEQQMSQPRSQPIEHTSVGSSGQGADYPGYSRPIDLGTTGTTASAAINGSSAASGSFELSNNVVYEGPATVPPAGDFYFSSSERLPNSGDAGYRDSNVWWTIGVGRDFERASNLTRDDFVDYCSKSELLVSDKQRSLCKSHPKIMAVVARGLKMAIDECQSRFSTSRWNCSLVLSESLDRNHLSSKSQPFGDAIQRSNRERSFLNAIISAGIAHAMTKACSQGELPEECSCDKRIKSRSNKGKIEWVACSDDIDYGARFSRDFTDQMEGDTETTSMINSHNYEVGRRIFKSATDITCSCQNGENGLCQTKRCWKHLSPFSEIGDELIRRYESATHVQVSSKDPHKLRPVRRGVRKPKRKDLVFIDESPDYCEENSRLGILGTQNRRCNSTTLAIDSCSILCCGRGYQVMIEEIEEDCNCKFVWCCKVKCDRCKRQMTVNVCN